MRLPQVAASLLVCLLSCGGESCEAEVPQVGRRFRSAKSGSQLLFSGAIWEVTEVKGCKVTLVGDGRTITVDWATVTGAI